MFTLPFPGRQYNLFRGCVNILAASPIYPLRHSTPLDCCVFDIPISIDISRLWREEISDVSKRCRFAPAEQYVYRKDGGPPLAPQRGAMSKVLETV